MLPASLPVSMSSDEALEEQHTQADGVFSTFRPRLNSRPSLQNTENHQLFTAHVAGGSEASHDGVGDAVETVECPRAASKFQWRPKYLRRRVLALFSVTFLLMIAALELLSVISTRNDGIAKGLNKDHYLWTYGPTAFLTLIAALFNRVEYQAKIMAPWDRLSKHTASARKTLLVDYVSPLQPVAIYESLRNKDFAVAATTAVSVLIKLLIVLSSGLITLSRVGVHNASMPMEVQNEFIDDATALQKGSPIPYYVMRGLIEGRNYPQGISDTFAFQSVKTQLPGTAQYQVTVDGLRTFLECEIAMLNVTGTKPSGIEDEFSTMNFTITSPGCDVRIMNKHEPGSSSRDGPYQLASGSFSPVSCDAGYRLLIMFTLVEWFDETMPIENTNRGCTGQQCRTISNVRGKMLESAQLLCAPGYEITKVNVIQNGTEVQSVIPVEPGPGKSLNRILDHVSPSSFAEAYLTAFDRGRDNHNVWNLLNTSLNYLMLDSFTNSLLENQLTAGIDMSSLFDPSFIQSIVTTYYQKVGAIIAKQSLMQPTSFYTTGSAILMDDRLIMREWAVQWMAGLIAICMILSIFTASIIPRHGILPRSPSTLPGVASLVCESPDILEQLCYCGDAVSKTLHLKLEGSRFQSEVIQHPSSGPGKPQQLIIIKDVDLFSTDRLPCTFRQSQSTHSHPWMLHPASRLSLGLVLVALVVTLEATLHQSKSHDGLGDVGDNAYIHYTWTSLPAIIFGGLAMILSSIDFTIRSLAPYTSLSEMITADVFKTLDFLDMSVPSAIMKEATLGKVSALSATTTLLVASSFTIFSGSLFQGVSFSPATHTLLRANTSFGHTQTDTSFGFNSHLILLGNLSYPSFTYEDLALPQLLPTTAMTANASSNASSLSVTAVVPALRSHLECRLYDQGMIRTRVDRKPDRFRTVLSPDEEFLTITVNNEDCNNRGNTSFHNAHFGIFPDTSYFGVSTAADFSGWPSGSFSDGCSDYLFMWGKLDHSAETKVEHVAAMGCNQSIEAVDVETHFIGADLAIDMDNPPRPVPNTERKSTASLDPGFGPLLLYRDAPNTFSNDSLSNIFFVLTRSRYGIRLSMLGGGSDDTVSAAIKFQHGVFLAQALNRVRAPAALTSATLTPEQALKGEKDDGRRFEATVVENSGRQRVVQDAVSTRVLEALLLVTLILLGVGWVWLPKTNVLPKRSPTTIASAVALLAGGNLEEWVHELDSDTTGERGGLGETKKFWMGWGNVPDEEGILMGNENENGISRFGIFAIPVD